MNINISKRLFHARESKMWRRRLQRPRLTKGHLHGFDNGSNSLIPSPGQPRRAPANRIVVVVLRYLDGRDLKSLSLAARYLKDRSGPKMSSTTLLFSQSITDREPPPVLAHTLKLCSDNFAMCLATPYATPSKELGALRSTFITSNDIRPAISSAIISLCLPFIRYIYLPQ